MTTLVLKSDTGEVDTAFSSPDIDPIFPMKLAAAATGESIDTLRRRAKAGKIEIIRLGPRRQGIKRSQIEKYNATKPLVKVDVK